MDKETQQIDTQNKLAKDLVNHEGWKLVRTMFTDAILDLQNAFNIDDSDVNRIVTDLKARKLATTILFDILKNIEGSASQADENKPDENKSYIVTID